MTDRQIAILNRLRNDIITAYGCEEARPRINLGPCGRFARDFREQWNARFPGQIDIVFVMTPDAQQCTHVMVRLPDGHLYDGGYGVVTESALKQIIPGAVLVDMKTFDWETLDKWSYGLGRSYPHCPNYSDDVTNRLIRQHLDELTAS